MKFRAIIGRRRETKSWTKFPSVGKEKAVNTETKEKKIKRSTNSILVRIVVGKYGNETPNGVMFMFPNLAKVW